MLNIIDEIMDNKSNSYEEAKKLIEIKKNLQSYIDMEKFTNKIITIIDKSKEFSFRSERAKKFIDKNNPIFILSCNLLTKENISKLKTEELDKLTDKIEKKIKEDIISNISNFLTECIIDQEKYDELFTDLNFKNAEKFLTNIYILRLSVKDNCIYLSLFK